MERKIRPFLIVVSVCMFIGVVIDFFFDVFWLASGFLLLFISLLNGAIISFEDNQPGGWGHDENRSEADKRVYRRSLAVHVALAIACFVCGMVALTWGEG